MKKPVAIAIIEHDLATEPVPTANNGDLEVGEWPVLPKYPLMKQDRRQAPTLVLIVYLMRLWLWRARAWLCGY